MNGMYGTPLSGMQGASFQLNVVADNIANINTSGFESVEPILESLPAQSELGVPDNGTAVPASTNVGMGARAAATERSQGQAPLVATGNPLDLAISGPGMFVVRQANGQLAYMPQISLHLQPDGRLLTAQGMATVPPIRVPAEVTAVTVDAHGNLAGDTRGGKVIPLGKPGTTTFPAPENLHYLSGGLYAESLSSGRPQTPRAGSVQIMSGYQLGSTVDLASQMVELIQAERMYAVNSKALQTVDSLVNGIISLPTR